MTQNQKAARDIILAVAAILFAIVMSAMFPRTKAECVKIGGVIAIAGKC